MKMKFDDLSIRMKEQYEHRTRYSLPRRTFTIIRLDGKAWHTYTSGLNKPFDQELYEDIDETILKLMPEIQGSVFAYTQSDEISILLTDFGSISTSAWFDGNIQKIVSISASMTSTFFNRIVLEKMRACSQYPAFFDSRVFTIPDRTEVMNYFRWRQQDCIRNSLSMVAQAHFSHHELHSKGRSDMHEMLHAKGINWATDFSDGEKNGRIIFKEEYTLSPDEVVNGQSATRTRWVAKGAWEFSKDDGKLLKMIPTYPE